MVDEVEIEVGARGFFVIRVTVLTEYVIAEFTRAVSWHDLVSSYGARKTSWLRGNQVSDESPEFGEI